MLMILKNTYLPMGFSNFKNRRTKPWKCFSIGVSALLYGKARISDSCEGRSIFG